METIFKGILPFFLAMLMIILIHYVLPDRVIFAKYHGAVTAPFSII
ncbi:MAG: hypothetical protein ACOC0H_08035 [Thermodesulfobacteriota bacterium]